MGGGDVYHRNTEATEMIRDARMIRVPGFILRAQRASVVGSHYAKQSQSKECGMRIEDWHGSSAKQSQTWEDWDIWGRPRRTGSDSHHRAEHAKQSQLAARSSVTPLY